MAENTATEIDTKELAENLGMEEGDLTGLDAAMIEQLHTLWEKNQVLADKLETKAGERKSRTPQTVLEKLRKALQKEPTGLNKAAIDFLTDGKSPVGDVDPNLLLDELQAMLETFPGVTVDRAKLQPAKHGCQWWLRLYNSDHVKALVEPKVRKAAEANEGQDPTAEVATDDDDENGDDE